MPKTNEKVINSHLAEIFRAMRMDAGAEQSEVFIENPNLQPDITVSTPSGEPVILESEKHPARTVENDAKSRLGLTIRNGKRKMEQVIAVKFPEILSSDPQNLVENLKSCDLFWCLFQNITGEETRWPETGWLKGTVSDLGRLVQSISLSESRITEGSDILEQDTIQTADILHQKLAQKPDIPKKIAEILHQQNNLDTLRMAVAIISNAFVFHMTLAGDHGIEDPLSLQHPVTGKIRSTDLTRSWRRILKINYYPIFDIAIRLLEVIPTGIAGKVIDKIQDTAQSLNDLGVTRLPDLSGRMFQRLISDRRFLATYYTLPSSATLLAELALSQMHIDWSDPEAVKALKIADFACGTGTLLNAVYTGIRSRHEIAGGDSIQIHKSMMERSFIATDIMPVSVHLTSTNLSSAHPEVIYGKTSKNDQGPLSRIFVMPFGEIQETEEVALGSLDLLNDEYARNLFGSGIKTLSGNSEEEARSHESETDRFPIENKSLDMVVMNPPFISNTNHANTTQSTPSLAAFNTSQETQKRMKKKLKGIVSKDLYMASHGNAGLGSYFADLGNLKLKPGGILALILPVTSVQGGKAWDGFQKMLEQNYHNIQIVTIASTGQNEQAFSSDTGMGEALIIATRNTDQKQRDKARFVNLYSRPENLIQAAHLAREITKNEDSESLQAGSMPLGHAVKADIRSTTHAAVRNLEIIKFVKAMERGEFQLPRNRNSYPALVCKFSDLGKCGPIDRDISERNRGAFDIRTLPSGPHMRLTPTWPALWNHNCKEERSLLVQPDSEGTIQPGRTKQEATNIWKRAASRIHTNRDYRLNSQSLTLCMTEEKVIGGTAWPAFLCNNVDIEKILCLWGNTSLGIVLFWANSTRTQLGRARQTISRIPHMLVPNFNLMAKNNPLLLEQADQAFENLTTEEFLPANEAYRDPAREKLDQTVFMDLFGFDRKFMKSLEILRKQFCEEPSVHGGKSTRPQN